MEDESITASSLHDVQESKKARIEEDVNEDGLTRDEEYMIAVYNMTPEQRDKYIKYARQYRKCEAFDQEGFPLGFGSFALPINLEDKNDRFTQNCLTSLNIAIDHHNQSGVGTLQLKHVVRSNMGGAGFFFTTFTAIDSSGAENTYWAKVFYRPMVADTKVYFVKPQGSNYLGMEEESNAASSFPDVQESKRARVEEDVYYDGLKRTEEGFIEVDDMTPEERDMYIKYMRQYKKCEAFDQEGFPLGILGCPAAIDLDARDNFFTKNCLSSLNSAIEHHNNSEHGTLQLQKVLRSNMTGIGLYFTTFTAIDSSGAENTYWAKVFRSPMDGETKFYFVKPQGSNYLDGNTD